MPFGLSDLMARRAERQKRKQELAHRIPPGQELTDKWPVLHYGMIPRIDLKTWTFEVIGLVEKPFVLSYQEFMALPRVVVGADMHCVTGWSKLENQWEGVSFREIAKLAKPSPKASHALVRCYAGYDTNLPLDVIMDEDVLLAYRNDGQDLTPEHGWPLRLVVPKRYAWKSAKWVQRIDFMDHDQRGFWEQFGYHNNADPWLEERYSWQEV